MPTARPSISARDGVIVLRSVNAVNATARQAHADAEQRDEQGSPAATRLPSTTTSTTSATVRPMTSPGPISEVSWVISTL